MGIVMAVRLSVFFVMVALSTGCGTPTAQDSSNLYDVARFPVGPHDDRTPGSLCERPDSRRYDEQIAYCERDVESSRKWAIIREYDRAYGYQIERMNRGEFKIDHLIPLCMGGSNADNNLWPQHRTVYERTDQLEANLCELMAAGQIRQAEAVSLILESKHDLRRADALRSELGRRVESLHRR
jgi:hypothetical protein